MLFKLLTLAFNLFPIGYLKHKLCFRLFTNSYTSCTVNCTSISVSLHILLWSKFCCLFMYYSPNTVNVSSWFYIMLYYLNTDVFLFPNVSMCPVVTISSCFPL